MTSPLTPVQRRTWPALDGVRAVALVGVLTAHLFPVGHDVLGRAGVGLFTFFTLSGFLITGLVLKERERFGNVSFRLFYARRAVRLLPALLLVLVVLNVLSATVPGAIGDPPVAQNAKASVAAFFYVGNWYDLTGLPNVPQMGWLTHLWSLSVEEQFYLVWPVVLLLALRRSVGTALAVTSVMIVLSPVLRDVVYDGGAGGLRMARGTDTAADYLMWGCALALVQHRPGGPPAWLRRAGDLTALLGLGILLSEVFFYQYFLDRLDVDGRAPNTITLLAPASVLLIAGIVNSGRVVPWVLGLPPLQLLGRMSYGIYLWHFPIFLAVQGQFVGHSVALTNTVKVAVSLVVASLAYALVEKPINDRYRARLVRRSEPVALPVMREPDPVELPPTAPVAQPSALPAGAPAAVLTPAPVRPAPARRATAKPAAPTTAPVQTSATTPAKTPAKGPAKATAKGPAKATTATRTRTTTKATAPTPSTSTRKTASATPATARATAATPNTAAAPPPSGTPVVRPRPAVRAARAPRQR